MAYYSQHQSYGSSHNQHSTMTMTAANASDYYPHHGHDHMQREDQYHYQQQSQSSARQHGGADDSVGMAGIGARRMAQKQQQRQMQEQQRQMQQRRLEEEEEHRRRQAEEQEMLWRAEEERRLYEEEERHRWYLQQQQHEQEQMQLREEEERRAMQRQQEEYDEQQRRYALEQQRAAERERQQAAQSSSYGAVPSDLHSSTPDKRNRVRRAQTDSQATVRPQNYLSQASESTPSLHSAERMEPASRSPQKSRKAEQYDGYQQKGLGARPAQGPPQMKIDTQFATGDHRSGPVVRETVYETLPKATCADCGEQLPFDDLVHHSCMHDACQSPLLTRGLDSMKNSPVTTPSTGDPRSRSPFFQRYDEVRGDSPQPSFLSPVMPRSSRSTPSPQMRSVALAHEAPPRSQTLPSAGSAADSSADEEEERIRQQRKLHIAAQRAAKMNALRVQTAVKVSSLDKPATSPSSIASLSPIDAAVPSMDSSQVSRSHRRGGPGSSSSSSTLSTTASTSSFFAQPNHGTLTPSSSYEHVGKSETEISEKPSPRKQFLDLQDIEGMVREIEESHAASPQKVSKKKVVDDSKRSVKAKKPATAHQHISQRDRRPSESSVASSTPSSTSSGHSKRAPRGLRIKDGCTHDKSSSKSKKAKLCSVCLKAFGPDQPMVQRDGRVLCLDDYAELYLEKCRKCQQPVCTVGVRSRDGALPGLFHRECFSCLDCSTSFDDGTFYVFDGAPYCAQHYHKHNGTTCHACHKGIEGQCRQLGETGERYHLHCLTCQFDDGREFCKDLLHDYYVLSGKRLCEWHFKRVVQMQREAQTMKRSISSQSQATAGDGAEMQTVEIRAARRTTYLRHVEARKVKA